MHLNKQIEDLCQSKILDLETVSGGDINKAYKIHTENGVYFLKTNRNKEIIKAEHFALDYIQNQKSGIFPRVKGVFETTSEAGLLLNYLPKSPSKNGMKELAKKLASLHSITSDHYGFVRDNFIGTLPQINNTKKETLDWYSFFWKYRLLPQLRISVSLGYYAQNILKKESSVRQYLKELHSDDLLKDRARLIHGDLWAGNYLLTSKEAYLIDPAISYSHPWMDLAMTKLFGGFSDEFYQEYAVSMNLYPIEDVIHKAEFYQIYYLLAHLNMFGTSYKRACDRFLSKAMVLN